MEENGGAFALTFAFIRYQLDRCCGYWASNIKIRLYVVGPLNTRRLKNE